MRLARKLQIAYFSLLLVPALVMGSLVLVVFYSSSSTLGPYSDMEAPGWLKTELAAILDEDWDRYEDLRERLVIFIMQPDGLMRFPLFSDDVPIPESYPYPIISPDDPKRFDFIRNDSHTPPIYLPDLFAQYGTEWTLDLSVTPIFVGGEGFMVGWREPHHGIPGFIARKGWIIPLFVLTGMMFIPALIDARLRRSIQRLQAASLRLSSGDLDDPIEILRRDDLSDLAASLETARIELKDNRDRKARFLMAVSHDLRTPLTSIRGYIEALGDGLAETPEDFQRYLSVLEEKAGLLEGRIGELIDFARADTGGWKKPETAIDVADLCHRLDAAFRKDSGFAGREYRSEIILPEQTAVMGDPSALYRAWENLFSNALRYSNPGDGIIFRVGVEASEERKAAESAGKRRLSFRHAPEIPSRSTVPSMYFFGEVADSGDGIPEDFVPLLFEPFARADRGRNTKGIGLGLASVKAVAEAHGGTVDYRPGDDGGSVFRIRIPCSMSPAESESSD